MKEKKTEIATNLSSGAEKVETVEKMLKVETDAGAKKTPATVKEKAKKEEKAAEKRVEKALKEQEEKARKAAEKAKRKQARIDAAEKRRRERAHAKANKKQALARAEQRRKERMEERKKARQARREQQRAHRKNDRNNNGGWIAAVVTLGVTTLALATTVALGALEMDDKTDGINAAYRSTTYELVGIMEHVDDDLDRVRIAATPEQQGRILTDLLVQTRMAELDLEKFPVSAEMERNVTTFINRVAKSCEMMLAKLRAGEPLNEQDKQLLQHFYETNHQVRAQLDEFAGKLTDGDIMQFIKKGKGMIADTIDSIEKLTLPENGNFMDGMKDKMKGAGMQRNEKSPETEDKMQAKIDTAEAEQLCQKYFAEYHIQNFECIGETVCRDCHAYNVQGYDEKGTLLFAEIDMQTGALVRFDYFEDCNTETFDFENAQRIATQFLQQIGYENMTAMRLRENGTDTDFTFVYTLDDVAFYPDVVHVKVCRTRGVVTGFDASKYLRNHKERVVPTAKISEETAKSKLNDGLEVTSVRLTVVETLRGERAAYEFLCKYGEEQYLIYTDANTGAEISILNIKNVG